MRRFILSTLILITILSLLIGAAGVIGWAQPTPERIARLHLADCDLPCWNDITPGVSSVSEAKVRIDAILPDYHSPSLATLAAISDPASRFLIWTQYGDIDRVVSVVNVTLKDDSVATIGIGSDHTNEAMPTLSEALAIFGAPTCVMIKDQTEYTTMFYEDAAHHFMLRFSVSPLRLTTPVNNLVFGAADDDANCQSVAALSWQAFFRSRPAFLLLAF